MGAAQPTSQAVPKAKIPFKMRLKAWWDGNELSIKSRESGEQAVSSADAEPALTWTQARIALAQEIWGAGFSSPGEEAYILGMVKSLGLTPAMSVLDLGAGLGGAGRVMAQNFGCWVTSLESDPDLMSAGNEISVMAGMGKKAPVEALDPENPELKENAYDCVFSQEALFLLPDKAQILQQIDGALKEKGQLLLTDFVFAEGAEDGGALVQWIKSEPREPKPWTSEQYASHIKDLGYDVRVIEDISDRFKAMVLQGWAAFLSSIESSGLDHAKGAALVAEVELWTRRVQALDSGQLRVCRFHALKSGNLISVSEV